MPNGFLIIKEISNDPENGFTIARYYILANTLELEEFEMNQIQEEVHPENHKIKVRKTKPMMMDGRIGER